MAFVPGKKTGVLFKHYDLSAYFNEFSTASQLETAEVTTFTKTAKVYLVGVEDGTISLNGFFEDQLVVPVIENAFGKNAFDAQAVVTLVPNGVGTVGNRAKLLSVIQASFEVSGSVTDAVTIAVEMQPSGGVDGGLLLADLAARTANGNSSSQDNAAGTTNGGVAHMHDTAFSGFTNIVVKVQHSTDNSVWNDLITFTTITASVSERMEVAGTVNRYVRALWTVTGSGSATFAVAFARR